MSLHYPFQTKDFPTFKDNDFTKDNVKLHIGEEAKVDLRQRVKDDVEVHEIIIVIMNRTVANVVKNLNF